MHAKLAMMPKSTLQTRLAVRDGVIVVPGPGDFIIDRSSRPNK